MAYFHSSYQWKKKENSASKRPIESCAPPTPCFFYNGCPEGIDLFPPFSFDSHGAFLYIRPFGDNPDNVK
jgi:hypothetical protein